MEQSAARVNSRTLNPSKQSGEQGVRNTDQHLHPEGLTAPTLSETGFIINNGLK
jgi:hypothetical protein